MCGFVGKISRYELCQSFLPSTLSFLSPRFFSFLFEKGNSFDRSSFFLPSVKNHHVFGGYSRVYCGDRKRDAGDKILRIKLVRNDSSNYQG